MLSLEFVGLILLFAIIPFGQNEDLNATNGTLAINGPPAVEQATSSSLPPSVPAGPLERLGEFAKSLSPFPLNASAPAPPMDGNFTSTSPGANGANEMATNATGAFTPYNVTISPLEMPPTASTNLPPAVPVADPIDGGQSPLPLVNTTISTTTTSQPPQPPPQPASASTFNNNLWASMAFGPVFLMFLIGSMMI